MPAFSGRFDWDAGLIWQVGFVTGEAPPDTDVVSVIPNVRVLEFEPGHTTYSALIGRDILRNGVLTLSFDGHFSYSF